MARKPRVHFPTALYHVIARGNQRQAVFLDEKDFRTYLSFLAEYKTKHSFHLYTYALMKSHLHLLMPVEETPLSKIMQILQFRYTRYFNKRYRKAGHLFQGCYKAILCDKDAYLLELVCYIHLNPVRSGVVGDPDKYLRKIPINLSCTRLRLIALRIPVATDKMKRNFVGAKSIAGRRQ